MAPPNRYYVHKGVMDMFIFIKAKGFKATALLDILDHTHNIPETKVKVDRGQLNE